MMVLASIYLSVSASLPNAYGIKPVEIWLLFNLAYPFLVIMVNIFLQVLLYLLIMIITLIMTEIFPSVDIFVFRRLRDTNQAESEGEVWKDSDYTSQLSLQHTCQSNIIKRFK